MKTKNINVKQKLKDFFFENPTIKLRVRQIERQVGVPLPSVIRYTKELEKEGILKSLQIAEIKVYSTDRSSRNFLLEKQFFNIKRLFDTGLVDFLIEKFSNSTIIAFGSYAKGEDIESSDIDIYVESVSKQKINLTKFEKIL
ncbi:nucleotidyltransferase domain-containing protein, partial [Nanoarchaeota archaeon]